MKVKELLGKVTELQKIGLETTLPPVGMIFIRDSETKKQFSIGFITEGEVEAGNYELADFSDFEVISVKTNADKTESAILVYGKIITAKGE